MVFQFTALEALVGLGLLLFLVLTSIYAGWVAGRRSCASEVAQLGRSIASLVHQSREPKGGPPNIR